MAAPVLISSNCIAVDDDLDSIEVLSAQYRPTASVHHVYNTNHGTTSGLPGDYTGDTDQLLQRNLDAIRSVDDYDKENTFFFRPSPSPAKPGDASSFNHRHGLQAARTRSQSGGRAAAVDNAVAGTKSTLIAVPIYNGDMVLLDTAACNTDTTKEALSPEERKRKRITLAVGIIAGLIIIASILLVAITLNMTSRIDAIVKEQNDNIYDKLTASNNDYGQWKNSSSSAQNYPILQYANRDST